MLAYLILLPLLAGLAAFFMRHAFIRRLLWLVTAGGHTLLTALCWMNRPPPLLQGWLALDAAGLLFLSITTALFLAATLYGLGYLKSSHPAHAGRDSEVDHLFNPAPESVMVGCQLLFLASMTLVSLSHHFGLLWVAIEATTLASAPLIYYHRQRRSLEATWKYLLICSVGIALALLGTFFLGVATIQNRGGEALPLVLSHLLENAEQLQPEWLKAAFILLLVGYGAKMGLAPLHTWLPDAHSEAPSMVSALLSGALLNCAFLGILRAQQICLAAGLASFGQKLLVVFGLLSLIIAAAFILGQKDFKRLLAYSSVEHMGLLALGIGLGGVASFAALLHSVYHSLTKAGLFLTAGVLLEACQSKEISRVRGLLRTLPLPGCLWLAGFLAITGTPPFGTFFSEFLLLKGALDQGRVWVAALTLLALAVVFMGMATVFLGMTQGPPSLPDARLDGGRMRHKLMLLPPLVLLSLTLILGLCLPPSLMAVLQEAARAMGGM